MICQWSLRRDTDEIRLATSQTSGQVVQYITTLLSCLCLALSKDWSLTLIVLASIPLTATVATLSERLTGTFLIEEEKHMASAASIVERSVKSIATVKVFNAQPFEKKQFRHALDQSFAAWTRLSTVWGARIGMTGTLTLAMFASGFWYGSHQVQAGSKSPGTILTVFWASLLAVAQLQLIIMSLNVIERGKHAAASLSAFTDSSDHEKASVGSADEQAKGKGSSSDLVTVKKDHDEGREALVSSHSLLSISDVTDLKEEWTSPQAASPTKASAMVSMTSISPSAGSPISPRFRSSFARRIPAYQPLRRIWPKEKCHGEVTLRGVSFAYPSRPQTLVLQNVDIFIPAGETTFIVGGSGSGKSTIAHLLLRLYEPNAGSIEVDEQDVRFLDVDWCRANVAAVDQQPIVFDLSVHDNVALGLCGELQRQRLTDKQHAKVNHVPHASSEEVESACRMALLHDFVRDLDQGYDTLLGSDGATSLSGGQKQRLALARARLRDPPILVLDECTSALDVTSRLLVNEAIKRWRRGKTTIVITHDLSQVDDDDFVYLLDQGRLVEQGYRADLAKNADGAFARLVQTQSGNRQNVGDEGKVEGGKAENPEEEPVEAVYDEFPSPTGLNYRASRALTREKRLGRQQQEQTQQQMQRIGRLSTSHTRASRWAMDEQLPLPSSFVPGGEGAATAAAAFAAAAASGWTVERTQEMMSGASTTRHHSRIRYGWSSRSSSPSSCGDSIYSTTSTSQRGGSISALKPLRLAAERQKKLVDEEGAEVWLEDASIAVSLRRPVQGRESSAPARRMWNDDDLRMASGIAPLTSPSTSSFASKTSLRLHRKRSAIVVRDKTGDNTAIEIRVGEGQTGEAHAPRPPKIFAILWMSWRTQPRKVLVLVGLICTVLSGAVTPAFSVVLARLMATMGKANQSQAVVTFSLIVLGIALVDGILSFSRFFLLEQAANVWIRDLRNQAYAKVLSQDKAWFDRDENKASDLMMRIVKDAEDARWLINRIMGNLILVAAMVSIALVWSLIVGWQLTLAGLTIAPLFIGATSLQTRFVQSREAMNKIKREEVSKRFYDMAANVRGIRSMALEPVFAANFEDALTSCQSCATKAAPLSGIGFGMGEALTYLSEAFLYYVGAILIIKGLYDFERMVLVFNLLLFAVTFAAQTMAYLPGLTKSVQAAHDLGRLLQLQSDASSEQCSGSTMIPRAVTIDIGGAVEFRDVHFAYPLRPTNSILRGISFRIEEGERVALVGRSGCGKSTIAALLQRLYEPTQGNITLDCGRTSHVFNLDTLDVERLRGQLAVVSQHPNLFDDTVRANLLYGLAPDTFPTAYEEEAALRTAASQAHALDFIEQQLEHGFDTRLGNEAGQLSGGQKQRLAIARALVRVHRSLARILILDECTSALDPINQEAVSRSLLEEVTAADRSRGAEGEGSEGLTTIIVTHKLELMKRCDRILVIEEGRVVQSGTYATLAQQRGGAFAQLASAGEWGS